MRRVEDRNPRLTCSCPQGDGVFHDAGLSHPVADRIPDHSSLGKKIVLRINDHDRDPFQVGRQGIPYLLAIGRGLYSGGTIK